LRLFILIVLLLVAFFGTPRTFGQSGQPTVTVAVAPIFIPWIFDKTGVGQSIVEVTINRDGHVSSAKCIEGSADFPWGDHSFEQTALRWHFSSTNGSEERTARITFVLRIMPKGTHDDELTPIYSAPYQMEVRHTVFEPHIYRDPNPVDTKPKRRP
jgi:hypothetical protein